GPFHAGTTLVLLLALLALDRAGERGAGAAVAGVLLTLALVSDALALYVGVLPIVAVSLIRLATGSGRLRPDGLLLGAAALSVPASLLLGAAIRGRGGFATVPLPAPFAPVDGLPSDAAVAGEGL